MNLKLFVFFYCCFFSLVTSAQQNLVFHRITTEQGLAHDNINCFAQDKKGFIWIGTSNGLCRYDGSRIVIFRHNSNDSNSISDNGVNSLLIDSRNRIWTGTYWAGLNLYDEATRGFKHFMNRPGQPNLLVSNSVLNITEVDENHLLLGQGKLLLLDIKNKSSIVIESPKNSWSNTTSTKAASVFAAYNSWIDLEKKWWLTGEAGVVKYDPQKKQFELPGLRDDVSARFNEQSSAGVMGDAKGNTWIGSGAGLFEYNKSKDEFIEHYPARFSNAGNTNFLVRSVFCDKDGSVWFGGNSGLFHYFPSSGKYFVYKNDPANTSSLSDNNINCIYKDRQGILWIGTSNGLNAIYPVQKKFEVYQNIPGNKSSLQSNITRGSFKDAEMNTWIGTQAALECVNSKTGVVSQFYFRDPRLKTFVQYAVMPLLCWDSSTVWVGTWGNGLQLFDHTKKQFVGSYVYIPEDRGSISSNHITDLCRDDKGNLWIATWNGGIERLDVTRKKFGHYSKRYNNAPNDYITSIFFDGKTAWAGYSGGLLKYDAATDLFKQIPISLDSTDPVSKNVTTITGDRDGSLWLGTFKGMFKFDTGTSSCKKVAALADEGVSGIYIDTAQKLWLASSGGLKYYDPLSQKILTFTLKDGLPITYFPLVAISLCKRK